MCGIAGIYHLEESAKPISLAHLSVMSELIKHRGPDGEGFWVHPSKRVGFAHRRLSILDVAGGKQPMRSAAGHLITYNGEIYNYRELREMLSDYPFQTTCDTEVILAAYEKWGVDCLKHLRGMFAFAIWDEREEQLFCARDRFGIKPFYYAIQEGQFLFASEAKALLPFLPEIATDLEALQDYLAFQFCLGNKTLFEGISQLPSAHYLLVRQGSAKLYKYWEVFYTLDFDHTEKYFQEQLQHLIDDSIRFHLRSDVPLGAYVSGGLDSSIIAAVAARQSSGEMIGFHGKFSEGKAYDESEYARAVGEEGRFPILEQTITSDDFVNSISDIIYALDYPVAGPGSFAQFHVSKLAAQHRKVVLGGQGGDEIFGGYTRYLIAYFEQCIKAAIEGTAHSGNFIVTYESIIPNLSALKEYKPLLQEFWRDGLFDEIDRRYFRLINRAPNLQKEIRWEELGHYSPYASFKEIFYGKNIQKESYFDRMTHFDFKTLLPALLQVEDRMSMAHGLESRVPFLDHQIVEFAATMPSNVKFKDGTLKRILMQTMQEVLPKAVLERKNKMGFPVPLNEWLKGKLKPFVMDLFKTEAMRARAYFNHAEVLASLDKETQFGRKIWGLLSLELWHQRFHDQAPKYRALLQQANEVAIV